MTTTDRLAIIRARCVELLELASKRTPGRWTNDWGRVRNESCETVCQTHLDDCFDSQWKANKTFIAACAGAAEAGWRSTISTIDLCAELKSKALPASWNFNVATTFENAILAAWEGLV